MARAVVGTEAKVMVSIKAEVIVKDYIEVVTSFTECKDYLLLVDTMEPKNRSCFSEVDC